MVFGLRYGSALISRRRALWLGGDFSFEAHVRVGGRSRALCEESCLREKLPLSWVSVQA